ncbi:MAG: DUF2203 domain-containing protein [Verrucomicrobiales bacterium]
MFTPQEATRTLPLVRHIVSDINRAGKELQDLAKHETQGDESPEFRRRLRAMEKLIQELEDLGCYYKDWNFDTGLVDFPALINGEHVLLCWRSDEPELTHYHSYDSGFADRKPIPAEYLMEVMVLEAGG